MLLKVCSRKVIICAMLRFNEYRFKRNLGTTDIRIQSAKAQA